ncbi:MAG: hypothetical protein ABEJ42_08765 [Halobacteriaceae archaeon]
MTVVVVPLDLLAPPSLPGLAERGPLDGDECADLARAMARDVVVGVADSAADLLVTYPPADRAAVEDPEAAARALVEGALDQAAGDDGAAVGGGGVDPADVRVEVQAGSTRAARTGNALTHLLEREDASSAAVVDPAAPLVGRTEIDGAAMKLRSTATVLGPAERGRVYYAGFTAPVDFTDAYAPPALGTLAERARDVGHDVDFLARHPVVRTPGDLCSLLATVRARRAAGRALPEHTVGALESLGVRLHAAGDAADGLEPGEAGAAGDDAGVAESGGLALERY